MKKLFKKLKELDDELELLSRREKAIRTLPYYKVFGRGMEMKKDLREVSRIRKKLLNEKFTVYENIQIKCEFEKMEVASKTQTLKVA